MKPLGIWFVLLSIIFAGSLDAAPSRTKIAFLAGFSSPVTSYVLTDLNLDKGYRVFTHVYPAFEKQMELIRFDNQGEAKNTAAEFTKVVDANIQFVVGVSKTSQALVAAPMSDEKKIMMVTPLATNDRVTEGHPWVVRTCFSDSIQGSALSRFAVEELKARRILVFTNVDIPYSVDLSKNFISALGPKAQYQELKYVAEGIKPAEMASQIQAFKPDLAFVPDYVNTASVLIKELYKIDPKLPQLGGDGWGGREVLDPAIAPLGELKAFYTTVWSEDIQNAENKKFIKAYRTVFPNDPPSIGAATMYDALKIFWEAYQAADAKTPEGVKKQLTKRKFQTTTGPSRFANPDNLTASRKVVIIRLNSGKHEHFKSF
jgi:branched-chain amino acid transport system substrate-binding protein